MQAYWTEKDIHSRFHLRQKSRQLILYAPHSSSNRVINTAAPISRLLNPRRCPRLQTGDCGETVTSDDDDSDLDLDISDSDKRF